MGARYIHRTWERRETLRTLLRTHTLIHNHKDRTDVTGKSNGQNCNYELRVLVKDFMYRDVCGRSTEAQMALLNTIGVSMVPWGMP